MKEKEGNNLIKNEKWKVLLGNENGLMEKIVLRIVWERRINDDGGDEKRIVIEKRIENGNIIIEKSRGERRKRRGNEWDNISGENEKVVGRKEGMVGEEGKNVKKCIGEGKEKREGSRIREVIEEFENLRKINKLEKDLREVELDRNWKGKIEEIMKGIE